MSASLIFFMFKSKPTIVVPVFDRESCFSRLLEKLNESYYPKDNIDLIISIDNSNNTNIFDMAEEFVWKHGIKEIIRHNKHLGLKEHIFFCGELTKKYKAIILIEDDVILSKEYYQFASSALKFFNKNKDVFSISLTSFPYDEFAKRQFYPIDDGFDNYFTNTAATWAFTLTDRNWKPFRKWFSKNTKLEMDFTGLPEAVISWSEGSFKKILDLYLLEKSKYFAIPRKNLAVNSGNVGTHYSQENLNFSVPILISKCEYKFTPLNKSIARYDAFLELETERLKQLVPNLKNYDFTTDLKGIKSIDTIKTKYILTSRECNCPIRSYGLKLIPFEMNIIENIQGDYFHLCRIEDCIFDNKSDEKKSREISALH